LEKNEVEIINNSTLFFLFDFLEDFACSRYSTTGTWLDFKTQWQHLRTRFLVYYIIIHYLFVYRTNCPKMNTPLILLTDEQRQIWDKSESIQDKDQELIDAILARYEFNEVPMKLFLFIRKILNFKGIYNIKSKFSTIWYSNLSRLIYCTII